jgi:hypothetical protein
VDLGWLMTLTAELVCARPLAVNLMELPLFDSPVDVYSLVAIY